MIKQSDCTIIIPHYGSSDEAEYALDECLQSLKETVPDIKIILAINGRECGLTETHKLLHDKMEYIEMDRQGQAGAVNAAVATTNTPWIFVTNDDMIYAPGWFEKLQEYIWTDAPQETPMMCISPMLVEPRPGAPTFLVEMCGGAGGDFDKQKWLDFASKERYPEHRRVTTGFNLPFLIKRELWDLIGGYDVNYDPWGSNSDSDLEYKIKLAGIQPMQNKNCIVYHFSQTSGTFEPRNDEYRFKNYEYFRQKWGFDRTDDGIWEASFSVPTPEQGRIFQPDWENKYK